MTVDHRLVCAGFDSRTGASPRQINQLGGRVRKGEPSTPAVFWKLRTDDVQAVMAGGGIAQRAADHILGRTPTDTCDNHTG